MTSIGQSGPLNSLQREALISALRSKAQELDGQKEALLGQARQMLGAGKGSAFEVAGVQGTASEPLLPSLREVNAEVQRGEKLAEALLTGQVSEFHEVAAQIKRADLTFKFSLEIRNRLIDAYREVMRMSV